MLSQMLNAFRLIMGVYVCLHIDSHYFKTSALYMIKKENIKVSK